MNTEFLKLLPSVLLVVAAGLLIHLLTVTVYRIFIQLMINHIVRKTVARMQANAETAQFFTDVKRQNEDFVIAFRTELHKTTVEEVERLAKRPVGRQLSKTIERTEKKMMVTVGRKVRYVDGVDLLAAYSRVG